MISYVLQRAPCVMIMKEERSHHNCLNWVLGTGTKGHIRKQRYYIFYIDYAYLIYIFFSFQHTWRGGDSCIQSLSKYQSLEFGFFGQLPACLFAIPLYDQSHNWNGRCIWHGTLQISRNFWKNLDRIHDFLWIWWFYLVRWRWPKFWTL